MYVRINVKIVSLVITFLGRKAFQPSRQDIETHRDTKLPDNMTDIAHDHHAHSIQVGTARWILLWVDDGGDRGVTIIEVVVIMIMAANSMSRL